MPRHEAKAVSEFKNEILQVVDNRLFKVRLVVFGILLKSQEFKTHRILDDLLRCFGNAFLPGDRQYRRLVVAQTEAFPQLRMDLAFQLSLRPVVIDGFKLVIFTLIDFFYRNQQLILRPVQLRTQRVRNWVKAIELAALIQLPHSETAAVLNFKSSGKAANNLRPVFSTLLALLLFLEDPAPQIPVHHHTVEIHASSGVCPRHVDDLPCIRNKTVNRHDFITRLTISHQFAPTSCIIAEPLVPFITNCLFSVFMRTHFNILPCWQYFIKFTA